MQKLTHIGLDVHKETIAVAVLRPGTAECEERMITNTPEALRRLFSRYARPGGAARLLRGRTHRLRHLAAARRSRRALRGDRPLADPQAQRRARKDRPQRCPQPRAPAQGRRAHSGARAHAGRGGAARPRAGARGPEERPAHRPPADPQLPAPLRPALPGPPRALGRALRALAADARLRGARRPSRLRPPHGRRLGPERPAGGDRARDREAALSGPLEGPVAACAPSAASTR